ncbi:ABC-type sugar transport system ATPase subunit [Allocatelliglobosispora scoriae]|uniref:ABC-type sugar transport system ATPase subunit n=1 Tax=Allocatelliglobosispora scoriae TaxID=643052 RepID=A0A841BJL8_9ACTN|nr:sugar ABC transporter ATP-binding protein [Allocatelliglobosispora scoriae]MBB5867825.1 ABC-type sugar transport system ATPase subunit [Allocatelliglobosispora scoriae]
MGTDDDQTAVLLQVDRLTVEFPGVRALDDVHFDVRPGEVHALVGENGAGKSTLLKVLGGLHRPSAGEIRLSGSTYRPRRPADALHAGIAVIYQEFNLYPDLTVAENVFSGREPYHPLTRGIDYAQINRRAAELFEVLGVSIDPTATVGTLTVSEQQLVEIAKALSVDGRIIVMDEPTAALSADEVTRLLDVVRRLRSEGRSVVYVSHRLDEVFAVADRVTVLRDGRHVRTAEITATDQEELVRLMVGRDISSVFHREEVQEGALVLELDGVSAGRQLRGISLKVRAGEIVGIGGVAGAGQPELSQVIFGALAVSAGAMTMDGRAYKPKSPADAMAAGVGFLHEDRKAAGILPDLSVRDNLTISVLHRVRAAATRLLSPAAQTAVFADYRKRLAIRTTGPDQLIGQLSGGNQQKVLFGRALAPGGRLLILNEPTRGVDIGAKVEIHHLINEVTADGTAVLMISSDLPELLGVSDRVYVLAAGEIVGHLEGQDRTEENVIACATTGRRIFSEVSAA